jgi:hypothetical protein
LQPRRNFVAPCVLEQNGKCKTVLNGLPGTLAEMRDHRVSGIAEKRDTAFRPIG